LLIEKPIDGSGQMIELIGQAGGPSELRKLYDRLLEGMDAEATRRTLGSLEKAGRVRGIKPSGDLGSLKTSGLGNDDLNAAAIRLAGAWKLTSRSKELIALANDRNPVIREAAFASLRDIGGKEVIDAVRRILETETDPAVLPQAAIVLASLDLSGAAPQVVKVIGRMSSETNALALWRSLLAIKGAGSAIARSLPQTGLPEVVARSGLRAAREGGRSEPELVLALARSSGLPEESQSLTEAELKQIAAKIKNGEADRGELVYRRKELGCITCHAIGGAGGRVGPDMSALGASAPLDYIVESVFAPNKKVKEGFHSVQVQTKDGQEISGILVRETTQEMILRDATNKEISVPKKNIASSKIGGSIMPAGLVDALTEAERTDLLRFLSELGKPGPYDASKSSVARVWRINPGLGKTGEEILKSDFKAEPWRVVYATVDGSLLKNEMLEELGTNREVFYAAAQFQTAKPGSVRLRLDGVNSPKAWLDGKPVGGQEEITSDLAAGSHTLVVKLDPAQLPGRIRLQSAEAAFLVE
jgi:putative heme-binding domain-containing protein